MSLYTAFYFVDADTGCTHLFAWDRDAKEWRVPCGLIPRPHKSQVTYEPTKPMCRLCVQRTEPKVTTQPDRNAPRARNR
jgi:hypothetical protein